MAQLLFGSVTCGPWTPRGFSESQPSELTQVSGVLLVSAQDRRCAYREDLIRQSPIVAYLSQVSVQRSNASLAPTESIVSSRYEQSSLVVSSNTTFSAWAEIFGDAVAVEAMVDRVVHHSHILTLKGDSYRLKSNHKEMDTTSEPR